MTSLRLSYYILQKWLLSEDDPELSERLVQCQAALLDMMIQEQEYAYSEDRAQPV